MLNNKQFKLLKGCWMHCTYYIIKSNNATKTGSLGKRNIENRKTSN
jgi:hypothetical protein